MLFTKIDRYVILRAILAFTLVMILLSLLIVGMDLLLRLQELLRGDLEEGQNRWTLIAWFYAASLPTFLSPLLPFAMVTAALVTCGPMLKRGEFIALSASGISLRRTTATLLVMALGVGAMDVVLVDQVAPRVESSRQALEAALGGTVRNGANWLVPSKGSRWNADLVILQPDAPPIVEKIMAISTDGQFIRAKSLQYEEGRWFLEGPIVHRYIDHHGIDRRSTPRRLECVDSLALPEDHRELTRLLISRQALTGVQLWQRGERPYIALLSVRYGRFFVTLALVLMVLPIFIRFNNRDSLMVAAIKSLGWSFLPTGIVAAAAHTTDANLVVPPAVSMAVGTTLAFVPGLIVYYRWRL